MNVETILTVARGERRRDAHRYAATRRQRALIVLGVAVLLPILGLVVLGAYGLGQSVAAGADALQSIARWYLPGTIVLFAFLGAVNGGNRLLGFQAKPLLLTTVPTRELVYGLLVADGVAWMLGLVGPALVLVAAFAVGTGSLLTLLAATLAVALLSVTSMLVGVAVGLAARVGFRKIPLDPSTRSLLGTIVTVSGALAAGAAGAVLGSAGAEAEDLGLDALVPSGPPPIPLGYYADWLFLGTPVFEGVSLAATGSLAVVVLALPLALLAIQRLVPRLWYADPTLPDVDEAAESGDRGEAWGTHRTKTGLTTAGLLRRAKRTPLRHAHVAYYLVVVGVLAIGGVTNPEAAPMVVGGSLVLLAVWLAGGVFGLNPVGDEGSMLGQLVLTTTRPETFVRARIVAGMLVAAPVLLVGTALMVVGGLTSQDGLLLGVFWLAVLPVSAAGALGLGTLFPQYDTGTVMDAAETVPPEMVALVAHAVLAAVLAIVGAVGLTGSFDLQTRVLILGVVAVGAVLLGDGGYRYAVGALSDYGRPRRRDPIFAVELGAGLAVLGLAASTSLSLAALVFVPLSGTPSFVLAFVAGYLGYATVVATYVYGSGRGWDFLAVRLPRRSDRRPLALGLVGSFAVYGALLVGASLGLPVAQHSIGSDIAAGGPTVALVLVALALLVNGPVEELLFRGVIQQRLAAVVSERTAIALAAGIFSLVHLPVYATTAAPGVAVTLTTLALLGGVWGWVYARTESVVPPALCHGLYNAALFGIAYVSLL